MLKVQHWYTFNRALLKGEFPLWFTQKPRTFSEGHTVLSEIHKDDDNQLRGVTPTTRRSKGLFIKRIKHTQLTWHSQYTLKQTTKTCDHLRWGDVEVGGLRRQAVQVLRAHHVMSCLLYTTIWNPRPVILAVRYLSVDCVLFHVKVEFCICLWPTTTSTISNEDSDFWCPASGETLCTDQGHLQSYYGIQGRQCRCSNPAPAHSPVCVARSRDHSELCWDWWRQRCRDLEPCYWKVLAGSGILIWDIDFFYLLQIFNFQQKNC